MAKAILELVIDPRNQVACSATRVASATTRQLVLSRCAKAQTVLALKNKTTDPANRVFADILIPSHYGVPIPVIFILVAEYSAAVSLKESDCWG